MSIHPNARLVENFAAAWLDGDMAAFWDMLDPEVVFFVPGRSALAGTHKGRRAVMDARFWHVQELAGTSNIQLLLVFADDEKGLGLESARFEAGTAVYDDIWAIAGRFANQRLTGIRWFPGDLYAFDEFFS